MSHPWSAHRVCCRLRAASGPRGRTRRRRAGTRYRQPHASHQRGGYVSVHQNGATVVTINVNQVTGAWSFGIGTRINNTISGTLFDSRGFAIGTGTTTLTSSTALEPESASSARRAENAGSAMPPTPAVRLQEPLEGAFGLQTWGTSVHASVTPRAPAVSPSCKSKHAAWC